MYHILLLHSVCLLGELLKGGEERRRSREREGLLGLKKTQGREASEGLICGDDQERNIKNGWRMKSFNPSFLERRGSEARKDERCEIESKRQTNYEV